LLQNTGKSHIPHGSNYGGTVNDQEEFYQLLNYKSDVNLKKKLAEWEKFYNLARPHGAHQGKTPYELLIEKLA
jgi:hypothetical protein